MMDEITLSYEGKGDETIRVVATPSYTHPEQCTFRASGTLYPDNSAHFSGAEQALGSPLIEKLFALDAVAEASVSHDLLRVTLRGEASWTDYIPKVGAVIRDALLSGEAPISEGVTASQLPADEIRRRVQGVLETVINPAVAAHGGMVNLLDVANNTVYLEFGGGCQGCGMINVTLKYGVERAIREEVPEVGDILDTTDHAAGNNPYYAPSSK
ncbi:MAG: NifU family protein [Candidatus Krumholzibacteria bacterium]|nr:NifU family protein [Candidatus Krumholzibacteria bacterium]